MEKKSLKKSDIISAIAKDSGITLKQAQSVLDCFVSLCQEEVKNGVPFRVRDLGIFSLKQSKERNGINPSTGEKMVIPAGNRMAFKGAESVKNYLNS